MPRRDPLPPTGTGQISSGPHEDDGLVPRTLNFIREQLPAWRDDPRRPKKLAEKGLNSSLYDFLDVMQRRSEFPMVRFKHEAPRTSACMDSVNSRPLARTRMASTTRSSSSNANACQHPAERIASANTSPDFTATAVQPVAFNASSSACMAAKSRSQRSWVTSRSTTPSIGTRKSTNGWQTL